MFCHVFQGAYFALAPPTTGGAHRRTSPCQISLSSNAVEAIPTLHTSPLSGMFGVGRYLISIGMFPALRGPLNASWASTCDQRTPGDRGQSAPGRDDASASLVMPWETVRPDPRSCDLSSRLVRVRGMRHQTPLTAIHGEVRLLQHGLSDDDGIPQHHGLCTRVSPQQFDQDRCRDLHFLEPPIGRLGSLCVGRARPRSSTTSEGRTHGTAPVSIKAVASTARTASGRIRCRRTRGMSPVLVKCTVTLTSPMTPPQARLTPSLV